MLRLLFLRPFMKRILKVYIVIVINILNIIAIHRAIYHIVTALEKNSLYDFAIFTFLISLVIMNLTYLIKVVIPNEPI